MNRIPGTTYIVQLCCTSLSLLASATILCMLFISNGKLSTPYRRIIFGLSAGDVLQSLALFSGPFMIPSGTPMSPWSIGNVTTCDTNGFLLIYGSTIVPLYMLLLCIYFYSKIVKSVSNTDFSKKIEVRAHYLINSFTLVLCITALVLKSFNPLRGYSCNLARYPYQCFRIPEEVGDCTRGIFALLIFAIAPGGSTLICLLLIMIIMTMICYHVIWTARAISTPTLPAGRTVNNNERPHTPQNQTSSTCLNLLFSRCKPYGEQRDNESDIQYRIRIWKRETMIQALLFVLSLSMSYVVVMIMVISNVFSVELISGEISSVIFFQALFPLMGVFNVIIYTRIKVKRCLHLHPTFSRLKCFWLVIKAGGEVPDETVDPNALLWRCQCCDSSREQISSQEQSHSNRNHHDNNQSNMSDLSEFTPLPRTTLSYLSSTRVSNVVTSINLGYETAESSTIK